MKNRIKVLVVLIVLCINGFVYGQELNEHLIFTVTIKGTHHGVKTSNSSYWIIKADDIDIDKKLNKLSPFYYLREDLTNDGLIDCKQGNKVDLFTSTINTDRNFEESYIKELNALEGLLGKNKKSIQCIKKKWFDGGKTEISVYVTPINGKFISCQPKDKMKKRFSITQEIVLPISNFTLLQEKYLERDNISSFLKYTDFSDYSKQNRVW